MDSLIIAFSFIPVVLILRALNVGDILWKLPVPLGKRPNETSVVCAPKLIESTIFIPESER